MYVLETSSLFESHHRHSGEATVHRASARTHSESLVQSMLYYVQRVFPTRKPPLLPINQVGSPYFLTHAQNLPNEEPPGTPLHSQRRTQNQHCRNSIFNATLLIRTDTLRLLWNHVGTLVRRTQENFGGPSESRTLGEPREQSEVVGPPR